MRYILALSLFFLPLSAYSIEISDFKSGLMCGINKKDMGWVCFEQEEILISGQSTCESQGKEFKCTWYGSSFNYSGAKIGQEINCSFIKSIPMASINLVSESQEKARVHEFTFSLDKEEGYFVNPQYSTLGVSPDNERHKVIQDVKCSSNGQKLYEYRFITVNPPRI